MRRYSGGFLSGRQAEVVGTHAVAILALTARGSNSWRWVFLALWDESSASCPQASWEGARQSGACCDFCPFWHFWAFLYRAVWRAHYLHFGCKNRRWNAQRFFGKFVSRFGLSSRGGRTRPWIIGHFDVSRFVFVNDQKCHGASVRVGQDRLGEARNAIDRDQESRNTV